MAEQAAHNRLVEGSNPSGPIFHLPAKYGPLSDPLPSASRIVIFHIISTLPLLPNQILSATFLKDGQRYQAKPGTDYL